MCKQKSRNFFGIWNSTNLHIKVLIYWNISSTYSPALHSKYVKKTLNSENKLFCIQQNLFLMCNCAKNFRREEWKWEKYIILWYLTVLFEIHFGLITRKECKRIWIIENTSNLPLLGIVFLPYVISWAFVLLECSYKLFLSQYVRKTMY